MVVAGGEGDFEGGAVWGYADGIEEGGEGGVLVVRLELAVEQDALEELGEEDGIVWGFGEGAEVSGEVGRAFDGDGERGEFGEELIGLRESSGFGDKAAESSASAGGIEHTPE